MQSVKPIVGIMMGSQSDWTTMKHTKLTLEKLGVPCEAKIISAHRTPSRLVNYVESAKDRGILVLIAGAGMAAALPGAVAALTSLPVLGVPMEGKVLGGLDAMLAMAQMPGGIPVGTLAVGKAGAVNSAILATSIIALSDEKISINLDKYRAKQTADVNEEPID
ncbi:MAG: 5-(carboxyamino)imidazole ribonucleotide mutase [Rhodospirillaceae bacterium]|nr:5-(carboxyamino)imidazole ribonucleotide mutase [Rhodospirillaceae bacterium]OUT78248.1 MAG: 5-(carboxyamino)imidazole ribonucleotide mutase [Rhodospirillaceae bacterium TMED23]|tara:strand:- start:1913 stop:2404 length:492 start_codon:yes stop_codon:yes gene_type:complete